MKYNFKKLFFAITIILLVTTTYAKTKKEKTSTTTEKPSKSILSKKKLQEQALVMPSVPTIKTNEEEGEDTAENTEQQAELPVQNEDAKTLPVQNENTVNLPTQGEAATKLQAQTEVPDVQENTVPTTKSTKSSRKSKKTSQTVQETPAKKTEEEQKKEPIIDEPKVTAPDVIEQKTTEPEVTVTATPEQKTTEPEVTVTATPEQKTQEQKAPEIPIIPPVIDTTQQIDRYKKVYLSDFMDIPNYDLPSDIQSSDADFITDLNDVDSFGRTSLMNAVRAGNDWKVRALLGAGADINARDNDGWTALMYAVRYQSNLPILNILLENNPDVRTLNNYGLSALVLASCYNDNPDIIKKMLSYYSPSEKEVQKAFVLLLSTQSISEYTLIAKMKVFIDLGLPINSYYDGKTPLMYACKFSSSTKAIKLLVDNNATISVRSSDGKTAFEYATENRNLKRDDIYWSLNQR